MANRPPARGKGRELGGVRPGDGGPRVPSQGNPPRAAGDRGRLDPPRPQEIRDGAYEDLCRVVDGENVYEQYEQRARGRCTERGWHIRSLLRLFRHRGVGWAAFAEFLDRLFEPGGPLGLKPVKHVNCPHWTPTAEDLRGRSLEDRQLLERQNFRGPALAHFAPPVPRCSYTGYTNARCAQKCALHQIRSLAREWLEWRRTTTLAQPDLLAAAQEVDEVELERWLTDAGAVYANDPLGDITYEGEEGSGEGPQLPPQARALTYPLRPHSGSTADPFFSSPPVNPGKKTKSRFDSSQMTVHTLAYLRKFTGDLPRLSFETRRLIKDEHLMVLHLCGCGIARDKHAPGCTEPSHLILGTRDLNQDHEHAHWMLFIAKNTLDYLSSRRQMVDHDRQRKVSDDGFGVISTVF